MKRTLLPLNALRVYDAAARHLSFTKAADELAVTPAAVGQQIRALEDHLGTVLFRRTSKGLELTEEGCAGLDALRDGFLRFEESVAAIFRPICPPDNRGRRRPRRARIARTPICDGGSATRPGGIGC